MQTHLIVQNQKKTEFDADLAERKANFETEMLEKKAAAKEEIEDLKNKYDLLFKDLQDEYASAKKKLELERKRDQEEYTYNLDRKRKKHLLDMGLTRGVNVKVKKIAPMGDPISIELRGYELCISKKELAQIRVMQMMKK